MHVAREAFHVDAVVRRMAPNDVVLDVARRLEAQNNARKPRVRREGLRRKGKRAHERAGECLRVRLTL